MVDLVTAKTVAVVSSFVMRGAVGLRANVFALERRGVTVWAVPTVLLPWHPGLGPSTRTPSADLPRQLDELADHAAGLDGVLTGYFASAAQVAAAAGFIDRLRAVRPDALVVVDPVTGDEGGRYVPDAVAEAIHRELVPRADVITPNINELWPRDVTDLDYTPESDALFVNRARRSSAVNGGFPRRLVGTVLSTFNPGDYFNPSTTQAGEPSINQSQPQAQQLWMLDALPSLPTDPDSTDETGFRVRYESSPPGIFSEDGTTVLTDEDRLGIAILQADQEMLGSAVFVPRCTEFIVEWSLGIIDRRDPENNTNYGQPIWHGLRRFIDRDGNGLYDAGFDPDDDVLLADIFGETYGGDDLADEADQTDDEFSIREPLGDWVIEDGNDPENTTPGGIDREMVELVRVDQRWNLNAINPEDALVAEYAFGYQYQDWNEDADGDGSFDNDNDDTLRPWPWPRLVRITMRFVDPSDPELERTYQAEFRVPVPRGEI